MDAMNPWAGEDALTYEGLSRWIKSLPRPKVVWVGFNAIVEAGTVYRLIDDENETVLVASEADRPAFEEMGGWQPLRERPISLRPERRP